MNALEIKTLIAFNLYFANKIILSWFFLFFLKTDSLLLNPADTAQISNTTKELALPTVT